MLFIFLYFSWIFFFLKFYFLYIIIMKATNDKFIKNLFNKDNYEI